MKKKSMSTKLILNELLREWNDQQFVHGYAQMSNDFTMAQKADEAVQAISMVTMRLGFQEGIDYTSKLKHDKRGDIAFSYWERTALSKKEVI